MYIGDFDTIHIHDLEKFDIMLKQKESFTDDKEFFSFTD
jgi:hypothetical protein